MGENLGKQSIANLEKLLGDNDRDEQEIEIKPDGTVVRLNSTEMLEKSLRLERERNEVLLLTIRDLRAMLKQIEELAARRK